MSGHLLLEIVELRWTLFFFKILKFNFLTKDRMNGFLMPVFDQIDFVCDLIKNDPELKDGYHAVGFRKVEDCLILYLILKYH